MNLKPQELRSFILHVAGALRSGLFTGSQATPNAQLDNLFPAGDADQFRHASPFGLSSGVPKGVAGFYFGLFGSRFERIILAMLDAARPEPSGPGETILYSKAADGSVVQVRLTLGADGTLTISAPKAVSVSSPQVTVAGSNQVTVQGSTVKLSGATTIALGDGGEATINGQTFITDFLAHVHTSGSPGNPTSPPTNVQPPASYLSKTVTAKK